MSIAVSLEATPRVHSATAVLFVATTFTGSALLFVVQPLFAKMVLPQLGGSPAVWNTCVLFFQAVLLLAYLYAHLSVRWLGARAQAVSHIALLLLPLVVLPVRLAEGGPAPGDSPAWWLLRMMTVSIGLPFFAVATMAPLVQRWFGTLPLRSARDPYFLYAASNFGSLMALLAFPFVLEPAYGARAQASGWLRGYLVLVGLAAACAAIVWRYGGREPQGASAAEDVIAIRARQRIWWVVLAFVPSSLMLGVTTHIATDIASVPLLWIVPLCLYLVTFIAAFSTRPWLTGAGLGRLFPLLALAAIAAVVLQVGTPYLILLHLAAFFACAMVCHGRLAGSRPPTAHLTEFYVWLSAGGVLGGAFNTLAAPEIFDGIYEYPLVLALGCLLRPPADSNRRPEPWVLFGIPAVAILAVCALLWATSTVAGGGLRRDLVIGMISLGLLWALARRRGPFNVVVTAVALLVPLGFGGLPGNVLFSDRSFFGMMKVIDGPQEGFHVLQHGTTLHGQQDVRIETACRPLSYFHRNGPIGQLFAASGSRFHDIAVIGLGTGALACYAEAGQRITFLEIDPLVERIARDPGLFTYLRNSAVAVEIAIGDGRKLLERTAPGSYDLIIADAFSSDSVPVHLMTREAMRMYVSRLRPGGVVAMHISNRYLELEPVVAATVAAAGLHAVANLDHSIPGVAENVGRSPSHWVLASAEPDALAIVRGRDGWTELRDDSRAAAWTDDYSNVVQALKLRGMRR